MPLGDSITVGYVLLGSNIESDAQPLVDYVGGYRCPFYTMTNYIAPPTPPVIPIGLQPSEHVGSVHSENPPSGPCQNLHYAAASGFPITGITLIYTSQLTNYFINGNLPPDFVLLIGGTNNINRITAESGNLTDTVDSAVAEYYTLTRTILDTTFPYTTGKPDAEHPIYGIGLAIAPITGLTQRAAF